jgi:hypothetical protein
LTEWSDGRRLFAALKPTALETEVHLSQLP